MKNGVQIFKDGVVIRKKNRRVVIKSNKRLRGSVILELYSVNNDNGSMKSSGKHVHTDSKLGRRYTGMPLSFDALRDISLAINLYDNHIESIKDETFFYK